MERSANQKSNDAEKHKPSGQQAQGGWGRAFASPQRTATDAQFSWTQHPPRVQIVGDFDHPDFRDALDLLGVTAKVKSTNAEPPELIFIAQSRPVMFPFRGVEALRRAAPLAGMVALAGTWCEGEPRTGRPWPGVQRLYWYEFPAWWQRQLAKRTARLCPDWARSTPPELRNLDCKLRIDSAAPRGMIIVNSAVRETADVLSDSLCHAGYATLWQRGDRMHDRFRGAIAGIWEGAQLNEREAHQLATFCRQLSANSAPVVALLDFPRRDRVDHAMSLGTAAVLGTPWLDADLIAALEMIIARFQQRRAA